MLNFISKSLENDKIQRVVFDDIEVSKSSLVVVDPQNEIVRAEIENKEIYFNLKAVKTIQFDSGATSFLDFFIKQNP